MLIGRRPKKIMINVEEGSKAAVLKKSIIYACTLMKLSPSLFSGWDLSFWAEI